MSHGIRGHESSRHTPRAVAGPFAARLLTTAERRTVGNRHLRAVVPFVLAAGLLGCSVAEPFGTVNGRVTLDGQPLGHGAISFDNAETKFAVAANLDERGAYVIRSVRHNGLPAGEYRVAISPATIGGGETPLIGDPSARPASAAKPIPERYHTTATSGLSATVKVGENPPYNFDLTSAKPR